VSDRLVIVDANYPDASLERNAAAPFDVSVERRIVRLSSEIPVAVGDAAGLLVQYLDVDEVIMAACPSLRVIGRYGVGVDNIDVPAASRRGIAVINVPDYAVEEVATHAVALMLAAWRMLPAADRLVRAGRWSDWEELAPIAPLSGATLGLVGLGRIGTEVVRQARAIFGAVVAHDPYRATLPPEVQPVGLEELLARSDVVSLHVPLTDATEHLMNAVRLGQMKLGSVLVNVSRGRLVDTIALASALDRGRPRMAALDVLPIEPPAGDDPLLRHPRTLLTNHVAWYSSASTTRLRSTLAERCAMAIRGKPIVSVVNSSALAGAS
jgi:D-3-phosphoglycerate dehydrogenase